MIRFLLPIAASIPLLTNGKYVIRGSDIVEERGLPDEVQRIQEIAAEADKNFYDSSQKIIHSMEKRAQKRGRKVHHLIRPIDFHSVSSDSPEDQ
jgi:hypothetical protein